MVIQQLRNDPCLSISLLVLLVSCATSFGKANCTSDVVRTSPGAAAASTPSTASHSCPNHLLAHGSWCPHHLLEEEELLLLLLLQRQLYFGYTVMMNRTAVAVAAGARQWCTS